MEKPTTHCVVEALQILAPEQVSVADLAKTIGYGEAGTRHTLLYAQSYDYLRANAERTLFWWEPTCAVPRRRHFGRKPAPHDAAAAEPAPMAVPPSKGLHFFLHESGQLGYLDYETNHLQLLSLEQTASVRRLLEHRP